MKKYLFAFSCLTVLLLSGCGLLSNTPKKQVEILLTNYQTLDNQVLNDLDYSIFFNTDLSTTQKDRYKEVMKKQYRDLTYTIKDEIINGDKATVEVEIEVYDLKRALNNVTPTMLPTENNVNDDRNVREGTNPNGGSAVTTTEDNTTGNNNGTNNNDNNTMTKEDNDTNSDNTLKDNIEGVLTNLEGASDRVKYTLYVALTKVDDKWVVDDLTEEQLEKINGIY